MKLYRLGESPEPVCLCDYCARDRFVLGEGEPLTQADMCQDCGAISPDPARPDPKPEKRHKATRQEWEGLRAEKLSFRVCRVCERPAESLHHLVPRGQGGSDVAANLVGVCGDGTRGCHGLIENHDAEARSKLRLSLTAEELEYVLERKGAEWLGRFYPAGLSLDGR